jgi:hypothetical protein
MWSNKIANLGEVKPRSVHHVRFEYLGPSNIKELKSSCGCSVAKFQQRLITVKFTTPDFPSHLRLSKIKETTVSRNIRVTTEDNEQHLLTINAIVKDV